MPTDGDGDHSRTSPRGRRRTSGEGRDESGKREDRAPAAAKDRRSLGGDALQRQARARESATPTGARRRGSDARGQQQWRCRRRRGGALPEQSILVHRLKQPLARGPKANLANSLETKGLPKEEKSVALPPLPPQRSPREGRSDSLNAREETIASDPPWEARSHLAAPLQ
ncbi:hypothetical protein Scep_014108 [Stephania cephalantha]|uniref:Uncharacterized protein n=1 Tax=Stephania cephalantha TaxID=152367 RepID=A0AAP0J0C3_9MAGN